MKHCCSTFNGDIITNNLEDNNIVLIQHKYYHLAVRRGMSFEMKYGPALVNSNVLRSTFTVGQMLTSQRGQKNIIISSGITNAFHTRGPYDVSNLYVHFNTSNRIFK